MKELLKEMEPESGANTPAIMLKIVVLPAPFGPIRALIAPSGISKEASCTARRPRNDLPTPRTSSSAIGHLPLAYQELDDACERDEKERRIKHQEVDADIAFAAAEHPVFHEELVAAVDRPEDRAQAGERAFLDEEAHGEQRRRHQRRGGILDEHRKQREERAHRPIPRRRASAGQMPWGRYITTASSTTP